MKSLIGKNVPASLVMAYVRDMCLADSPIFEGAEYLGSFDFDG